jgi:UDP-N-acetylglucosamine 2-epimerase (non-hydrolysing)
MTFKKNKKILIVFGTRPEAIKMASIVCNFSNAKEYEVKVCVTAQHRFILDQVLNLFEIIPDFDLNIMQADQDLTDITSNILFGMRDIFNQWRPDLVIVHGDTTTAMATSLAAFYSKINIAHVEAGLRTNNIYSPWPEEMNRRVISRLASLHFAPTEIARSNLIAEGCLSESIYVTGNTVIDALLSVVDKIEVDKNLSRRLGEQFSFIEKGKRIILVTAHRRENFGDGIENICRALLKIAQRGDIEIVYPVHPNPNIREPVYRLLDNISCIHLIQPLDYLPFVYLMNSAYILLTDSGGIQEEAPSLGKPVLVMRDYTERLEGIKAGTINLVGTNREQIINATTELLDDTDLYKSYSKISNPYGDGKAAERIIEIFKERSIYE